MKYDAVKTLKSFHNVRVMLRRIPRQLWSIFLPESVSELPDLESRIPAIRAREADRKKVMAIQQMCGFPLRPNASLREMQAKLKILRMKKSGFAKTDDDSDSDEPE
jgi:hypothetical protein